MLTIEAKKREKEIGRRVQKLRKQGFVPGIVYGHKIKSLPIYITSRQAEDIVSRAGESTIINLAIEGDKQRKVLIHQVARHPLTGNIEHIDFYQIREGEKITAEVEVELKGIAPAVKERGGILLTNLDHLEVEALPADLPPKIVVDISALSQIDDEIKVEDLRLSSKVKVLNNPEEIVVKVVAPRKEEAPEEEEAETSEEGAEATKEEEGAEKAEKAEKKEVEEKASEKKEEPSKK